MIIPPCKDCQERVINCHAICQKYKDFKTEKEIEYKQHRIDVEATDYSITKQNAILKKLHKRRTWK